MNQPKMNSKSEELTQSADRNFKLKAAVFMISVTGMALIGGFGMTLAMAKKRDPSFFAKGFIRSKELPASGSSLAMRALGWGTLFSVTGVGAFCYSVWKLMGVQNFQEFRMKMQSIMPTIPKNEPQGRTEFESLRDLLQHIIDESNKSKKS